MVKRVDALMDAMNAFDARDRNELERVIRSLLGRIDALFPAIAHGSQEHRDWLERAISDHFAGKLVHRADEPARK